MKITITYSKNESINNDLNGKKSLMDYKKKVER